MAGKHTYNCPVCEREKLESNHWLLVWLVGQHGEPEFSVRPWEEETARLNEEVLTVDGAACVHALLDRFLTAGAHAPEAQPATSVCRADPPAPQLPDSSDSVAVPCEPTPPVPRAIAVPLPSTDTSDSEIPGLLPESLP